MKRTKTRFFIERHNVTVLRSLIETPRLISTYSREVPIQTRPQNETKMAKRFSVLLTVPLGVVIWIASAVLVDLLVLQIYPVPPELLRHAGLLEIIASRPDAAVALNMLGGILALAFVTYTTTRFTRTHGFWAGLIVVAAVLILCCTNALMTHNFRWLHAIAFATAPVVGFASARFGTSHSL